MTPDTDMKYPHLGRNVKRLREMLGIKQEALAYKLGDGWTQKKISQLEASESIETELMDQVAEALGVPAEAIKHFSEETAINIFSNTFQDSSNNLIGHNYTFNPIDKIVELYERMLKAEQEKVALLEKLLKERG